MEKMSLCIGTLARKLRRCLSEKLMFEENWTMRRTRFTMLWEKRGYRKVAASAQVLKWKCITVACPSPQGLSFKSPVDAETMDSTNPYRDYVFSYTYIPKTNLYIRHSKRFTTIANNKIEQLKQYIVIKLMWMWSLNISYGAVLTFLLLVMMWDHTLPTRWDKTR